MTRSPHATHGTAPRRRGRLLRAVIAVGLLAGTFGYGFAAGAYRLFPFHLVASVKNRLAGATAASALVLVPQSAIAATYVETGLQRLIVKRIPLPNDGENFRAGGAIATSGNLLVATDRDGRLFAYDLAAPARLEVEAPPAPINRDAFMQSRARYEVPHGWFRTAGLHVEAIGDSVLAVFAFHNRFDAGRECFTYNISRLDLRRTPARLAAMRGWRTLLTTDPCMPLESAHGPGRYPWAGHISGGKLIDFDRDHLLVTVGDYTYDGTDRAAWSMNTANLYGKYVLLHKETGRARIHAIGGRNNMGLFRDADGTIWSTESGPQGGDELNVVREGANFGWPEVTLGIDYESTPWARNPRQGRHDRHDPPRFAWVPSVVPTNLARLSGTGGRFTLWAGDLVVGTLRDESLHRLRLDAAGRVQYDERIYLGERIRDLRLLPSGMLALLTDNSGQLVLLEDGGGVFDAVDSTVEQRRAGMDRFDVLVDATALARLASQSGQALYEQRCASCHALDGEHRVGPQLGGLFERKIGSAAGFKYSYDMGAATGRWDAERLKAYLADPARMFPGTRMPKISLSAAELDSVTTYLQQATRAR